MTRTAVGPSPALESALRELIEWLRIPSISGDQRFAADMLHAARWLAGWLRSAGATVRLVPPTAAPLVMAVFRGRTHGRPGVVYGHYDVQPPGPGWSSEPFRPVVRNGAVVARGASDDKGQFLAHLVALRNLCNQRALGADVLVIADGSEEIGSPGLAQALATIRRPAQAVVVSDTQRALPEVASITVSQRGLVKLDVQVDVGGRPVHPGRFGGGVVDPSVVLAASITRLADAIAQLPPSNSSTRVPVTGPSDRVLLRLSGGRAPARPPKRSRHAWLTTHASVAVSHMRAGGPAAAMPTQARALLDVRLPPGVSPQRAAVLVQDVLRAELPRATRMRTTVHGLARGAHRLPPAWLLAAAEQACLRGFGTMPAYMRSGGSVAAIDILDRTFSVAPLLLGLGPPSDGAHGPDECLDLAGWRQSVQACTQLWLVIAGNSAQRGHHAHFHHP